MFAAGCICRVSVSGMSVVAVMVYILKALRAVFLELSLPAPL